MNGRLCDPVLGRFLNADPVIQFPGFAQSYNSYSYVMNNPLRFTDPTGYTASMDAFTEAGLDNRSLDELQLELYGEIYFDITLDSDLASIVLFNGKRSDLKLHEDGTWTLKGHIISKEEAMFVLHEIARREASSGGDKVYYDLGSHSYSKNHFQYLPVEGVGINGGLHVKGNANVYYKGGQYYANVSASAFTPASRTGSVSYAGTVDVLAGNKVVGTYPLTPYTGPSFSQAGWTHVGQNVFALPGYSSGDVYLRFNIGYSYTEGAGYAVPIPGQGHYRMQVGFTIDALTY